MDMHFWLVAHTYVILIYDFLLHKSVLFARNKTLYIIRSKLLRNKTMFACEYAKLNLERKSLKKLYLYLKDCN